MPLLEDLRSWARVSRRRWSDERGRAMIHELRDDEMGGIVGGQPGGAARDPNAGDSVKARPASESSDRCSGS